VARPGLRAAGRHPGRAWLRGPADPNAVLTLMLVPHSAATPWVWRIRARALHFAALSVAAISVVAVLGVASARAEGGYLRLARGQLARLGGVRTAAAAQADAVDAQAAVLTQQAQELDALSAQVQALLSAQPGGAAAAGVPAMAGADQNLAQATAALQALSKELPRLQSQVAALGQEMAAWSSAAAHTPSLWPVLGPITSPFGERPTPFGGEGQQFHDGVDIGVPTGTPVHATADGRVIVAGWDSIYGWQVRIDHGSGLQTLYGHNSRLLVAVGEQVVKGQVISLSGSTGASTGPHVHYEVDRYGTPVNPLQYLPGSG
jgi:murein DD-endopeptidase MepM/ murein hydrolase activator NlpD